MLATLGRRWAHLLLGGALLMPFFFLAEAASRADRPTLTVQLVLFAATLPMVAITALVGPARTLMGVAARELLGATTAAAPARSVDDRLRTAAWSVAHLGLGALVSALTLAMPPLAALWLVAPWRADGSAAIWGPVAALALLAGLVGTVTATGALLTRLAGALLGPSAADRIAALRRQVREQTVRTRLARDLHDSLGHALSVISVQAGAGERRLDADPEFARAAFAAVRAAAFTASEELDRAIGLLGAEAGDTREPDLGDLDGLLRAVRDAGVEVEVEADVPAVPAAVSQGLYRVVQEGLTNAVRHGGSAPVRLRLHVEAGDVRVELSNPLGTGADARRPGRGLRGMADRVTALGGDLDVGPADGEWRIRARVPLSGEASGAVR